MLYFRKGFIVKTAQCTIPACGFKTNTSEIKMNCYTGADLGILRGGGGGGGGGSVPEFFKGRGGGGGVRVQVHGNFHIY